MDEGSSLNLIYEDTVRKMVIDSSRIKPSTTTFKGVIPGVEACCIMLEVVFGWPNNLSSEELIIDIVPLRSEHHALLGHTACMRFDVVLHYAYVKLKMPGPNGIIKDNGNIERSLRTEEQTGAFAVEVQVFEEAARSGKHKTSSSKRVRAVQFDLGHIPRQPK